MVRTGWRSLSPLPGCTGCRKIACRYLGPAAQAVSAGTPGTALHGLLLSGKLDAHLADMDRQAEELFSQLVEQMAEREGVTEQLKAAHQMEWVGSMNYIRDRVTEIIHAELIFT